jgi:phosphoribosyl 1,2-cyclic phosphodiesterase
LVAAKRRLFAKVAGISYHGAWLERGSEPEGEAMSGSFGIRFWGARGSLPHLSSAQTRYGGNTMCLEVLHPGSERVVLDAGTGIANLGDRILDEDPSGGTVHLFLSHYHWDHIMGLPFFGPIYRRGFTINLYGLLSGAGYLQSMLNDVFSPYYSPIYSPDNLLGNLTIPPNEGRQQIGELVLSTVELQEIHPGGYMLIQVAARGRSFLYASDIELREPAIIDSFVESCRGADVLVVNAAFSEEVFAGRVGWGHSSFEASCDAGHRIGVARVIGVHYDPLREDDELDEVLARMRARYPEMSIDLAREGEVEWLV